MFGFGGQKMVKVPEQEWQELLRKAHMIRELKQQLDTVGEELRDLRSRWQRIFPVSSAHLEEGALARIQEDLGIQKLIDEVRPILQARARERVEQLLEDAMQDERWVETLRDLRENIDFENVEHRLAELLIEWAKEKIDVAEITRGIVQELIENEDIDIQSVEDVVAGMLQERLRVTLEK